MGQATFETFPRDNEVYFLILAPILSSKVSYQFALSFQTINSHVMQFGIRKWVIRRCCFLFMIVYVHYDFCHLLGKKVCFSMFLTRVKCYLRSFKCFTFHFSFFTRSGKCSSF